MKKHLIKKISQVILMIFVVLILPESKADEKPESKSFDNSRVKVLYELTFPDCVETYHFGRSKDNVLYIDRVLTSREVYSVDEKHKTRLIMKRDPLTPAWTPSNEQERKEYEGYRKHVQQHPEVECGLVFNSFSPDGKYLVETIGCGWECTKTRVTNLENRKSIVQKDGTYLLGVSENSILITSESGDFVIDFNGKILNRLETASLGVGKGYKNGFVLKKGIFYLFNSNGSLINRLDIKTRIYNFDIDYETGTTAIVTPNTLYISDSNGQLKHKFKLPFSSYTLGVGVSPGGDYVSVINYYGKVVLYDIVNNKKKWTKTFECGGHFISWKDPVPVSIEGKYTVVYGKIKNPPVDKWSLIIFNKSGEVVGFITLPIKQSYIGYSTIEFIPGTTKLIYTFGRKLTVYEIK